MVLELQKSTAISNRIPLLALFLAKYIILISSLQLRGTTSFIIPYPHARQIDHDDQIDYNREQRQNMVNGEHKLHGTDLLVLHSHLKHVRKMGDCVEMSDHNATLLKSISRSSDTLVELEPNQQRFSIHYCANAPSGGQQECGENSVCGTIYRWKKATVRVDTASVLSTVVNDLTGIFMKEQVLVPSGCSCLINARGTQFAEMPIIIE